MRRAPSPDTSFLNCRKGRIITPTTKKTIVRLLLPAGSSCLSPGSAPDRWCSLVCSCMPPISASVFTWLSLHVSPNFLLLTRTPDIALGTPANSVRLHLNLMSLAKTLFPNEVPFTGPGGKGFNVNFLRDVIQSPSWTRGYAADLEGSQDADTWLWSFASRCCCCCSGGKQEPQETRWKPPSNWTCGGGDWALRDNQLILQPGL